MRPEKGRDEAAANPNDSSKTTATDAVSATSDKDVAAKKAEEDKMPSLRNQLPHRLRKSSRHLRKCVSEVTARQKEEAEKRNEPQQREVVEDGMIIRTVPPHLLLGGLFSYPERGQTSQSSNKIFQAAGAKADEQSDTRTVSGGSSGGKGAFGLIPLINHRHPQPPLPETRNSSAL